MDPTAEARTGDGAKRKASKSHGDRSDPFSGDASRRRARHPPRHAGGCRVAKSRTAARPFVLPGMTEFAVLLGERGGPWCCGSVPSRSRGARVYGPPGAASAAPARRRRPRAAGIPPRERAGRTQAARPGTAPRNAPNSVHGSGLADPAPTSLARLVVWCGARGPSGPASRRFLDWSPGAGAPITLTL